MPKVKVNDIEMYYEVHGEGTPLVLIQGYGGSSADWIPEIIQGFEDEFKVLVFDNRGTGQSDKPDVEYSINLMADDVACLMESIGIPRAHVLGLSMGGVIAQEMAVSHPDRVQSLVLCSTSCSVKNIIGASEEFWDVIESNARGDLSKMSPELILSAYSPDYLQANKERILKNMAAGEHPTPPVGLIRQAQATLKYDSNDRLPDINAPCLVLVGELDIIAPPENSRVLAERSPHAKLKIFEITAHMFLYEITDTAIQEIVEFLLEVDS